MQCKCGSYAINHKCHGRDGSDPDVCDVCYWRKRAQPAPRINVGTPGHIDWAAPGAEAQVPLAKLEHWSAQIWNEHPDLADEISSFRKAAIAAHSGKGTSNASV